MKIKDDSRNWLSSFIMYKLVGLIYYVHTYSNNYVYTVESVASTIADKEG